MNEQNGLLGFDPGNNFPTPVKPLPGLEYGLLDVLRRLQLSGNGQTFNNQYVRGYNVGGRIGYSLPMGDRQNLNLGVSGGLLGLTVNTPNGPVKLGRPQLNGLDATYQNGNHSFSADLGFNPDKRLMLRYMMGF